MQENRWKSLAKLFVNLTVIASLSLTQAFIASPEIAWITVVGNEGMIYRSSDGGQTWKAQASGVTVALNDVYFSTARHGIIVGDGATILQTFDAGRRWSTTNRGLTNASFYGVHSFMLPAAVSHFIVGQNGLLITSIDGSSAVWTASQLPHACFLDDATACSATRNWAADDTSPHLLRVRFFDNLNGIIVGRTRNLFITSDAGLTFTILRPVDLSSSPGVFYTAVDSDQASPLPLCSSSSRQPSKFSQHHSGGRRAQAASSHCDCGAESRAGGGFGPKTVLRSKQRRRLSCGAADSALLHALREGGPT
jgi:hypothetical protein